MMMHRLDWSSIFLQFGFSWASFMLNGIFVHCGIEAFFESAGSALIPMGLVNWATTFEVTLSFASIDPVSVNTSFEEARAA